MDLGLENAKAHEELERVINSDLIIDDKVYQIKLALTRIINSENMIAKFSSFLPANKVSNDNNNTESHG